MGRPGPVIKEGNTRVSISTGSSETQRGSPAGPAGDAGLLPVAGVTSGGRATKTRGRGWRRSGWLRLISPVVVLAVWQIISTTGIVSQQKLPSLSTLWTTAVHLITTDSPVYGTLQGAMLISLERVAIGFVIGGGLATILAVIAGLSRFGENAIDPIMQALRTLPLFGLIPVFIVWFGIGESPKITLIALAAAVPLYLNTFSGIRGVDSKFAELGQVLGLSRSETIRNIILPGALPTILIGLRQSLGTAWLALVVAEQINASGGLGYIINQGETFLQQNVIFVALIVYLILGLLTDYIVRLIERRALSWRRGILEG
jgi:sulfonate transport system permease protein